MNLGSQLTRKELYLEALLYDLCYLLARHAESCSNPKSILLLVHGLILCWGFAEATPKRILQMMNVKGLKLSHIKSHLQVTQAFKIYIINTKKKKN